MRANESRSWFKLRTATVDLHRLKPRVKRSLNASQGVAQVPAAGDEAILLGIKGVERYVHAGKPRFLQAGCHAWEQGCVGGQGNAFDAGGMRGSLHQAHQAFAHGGLAAGEADMLDAEPRGALNGARYLFQSEDVLVGE